MNHNLFKLMFNFYPPYWATGIIVRKVSPDYREIIVHLKMRWYNRNFVNTHFGGSLYSMTDPFFMFMLIQILGKEYIVWDKAAHIDFIKPGRGTVTAKFAINEKQIEIFTDGIHMKSTVQKILTIGGGSGQYAL